MELSFWLDANKIALDVDKTGAVFFKTKYKILDTEVTLHKLRAKQLHLSKSIKYLEGRIDENQDWKDHVNEIAPKLIQGKVIMSNYVIVLIRQHCNQLNFKSPIDILHIPLFSVVAQKLAQNRISAIQKKCMS